MKNLFVLILLSAVFASCKTQNPDPQLSKSMHKVLILGNSITYSQANPSIGWTGNWGMAASSADNDFVHLLTAHFKSLNNESEVSAKNIAAFENDFDTYNLNDNLKTYRDAKPDIIIIRIGENVTRTADSDLFEKKYVDLLNYFKTDNPKVKILAVGTVWPLRDMANTVLSRHSDFVSLVSVQNDMSNFAFGLFPDAGIQSHPSDKGMKAISDAIWARIQTML